MAKASVEFVEHARQGMVSGSAMGKNSDIEQSLAILQKSILHCQKSGLRIYVKSYDHLYEGVILIIKDVKLLDGKLVMKLKDE